jgi:hypothetical protein
MHAVNLQVVARVPCDCRVWLDADGWTGACEGMGLTVHGGSFEDAKRGLETGLQEQVERVLRQHGNALARTVRRSSDTREPQLRERRG